jgi:hypothetical protein
MVSPAPMAGWFVTAMVPQHAALFQFRYILYSMLLSGIHDCSILFFTLIISQCCEHGIVVHRASSGLASALYPDITCCH